MIKSIVVLIVLSLYVQAGDVVKDNDTGLLWQDSRTIVEKNYNDAKGYCKDFTLEGYSDWRLPNIDELISISDKSKYKPAIKSIFKNAKNDYYWSSSEYKDDSSRAWLVHFTSGGDRYGTKSGEGYVRCVSGRQ